MSRQDSIQALAWILFTALIQVFCDREQEKEQMDMKKIWCGLVLFCNRKCLKLQTNAGELRECIAFAEFGSQNIGLLTTAHNSFCRGSGTTFWPLQDLHPHVHTHRCTYTCTHTPTHTLDKMLIEFLQICWLLAYSTGFREVLSQHQYFMRMPFLHTFLRPTSG